MYIDADELEKESSQDAGSNSLHAAGPQALKEYNTFDFAILPDHDPPTATLQEVLKKFREYCQPRKTRFMRDTASGQETNRREKIIHQ